MRQRTFGCAMTFGAAAAAAAIPPTVTRNLRRSVIQTSLSASHKLVVGALGDAVPWVHQRLELREGGVNLSGHRCLLRFLPDNLCRELFEIAQHRRWKLEHLDLALELNLEPFESDGVPGVVLGDAVDLDRRCRVIQSPPQIDGE